MTTQTDTTPRAWVGCLACYNNGQLIGAWVDGTEADTFTPCPDTSHEERHVFDHEGYGDALRGECSPADAAAIARALAELADENDGAALIAYADNMTGLALTDWQDWEGEARDAFHGTWNTFQDFADQYAEECLLPEWPEGARRYFDSEAWASDLAQDFWTWPNPDGGVFVFRNF